VYYCVDASYQSLSSNCVKKRASVRKLKQQMQVLQQQTASSHRNIDAHVQQLVVSTFLIFCYFSCNDRIGFRHGCGLGRDVSVLRWSQDVLMPRSHLGQNPQYLGLGAMRVSGLGPLCLVKTFCAGMRHE